MFFRIGSSISPRPAMLALTALITLCLLTGATGAAWSSDGDQAERSAMAREIIDLVRQDLRAEALPLCRSFNEKYPGQRGMLYNQACLESTAGLTDEAAATFAKAVEAGFDDFRQAFSDPDLAGVKFHPDMIALSLDHQLRLANLATDRAASLAWLTPSSPLTMAQDYAAPAAGDPSISLTWTPVGLDIEFHGAGQWAAVLGTENLSPWNGGPGLVCTLGIPAAGKEDSFETANHFIFAFGMEKGRAVGAFYLAGPARWQPVAELQPKSRIDDAGVLELKATIPWATILPYDPLVDPSLGFNAAVRIPGPDGVLRASLLPDPAAFRSRAEIRRVVPVQYVTASVGEEIFTGKVSDTISDTEPVTFDLVAVSDQAGSGRLIIDFLGGPEQSLLPQGQVSGAIELTVGLNNFTRQADFSGLHTGAYVIKAELVFPSGRSLTWGSSVLQLAPGWYEEYVARVDSLVPHEQPTAQFQLDSINQAVADHHPRRSPGAIVTTINELGKWLDNARKTGSIFPEKGPFLAVYPGPDGNNRLCHTYLPGGWKIASRLNPVLMVAPAAGLAGALTDRIGLNYEQGKQMSTLKSGADEGFPVYLVPQLAPLDNRMPVDNPTDMLAEAEACLAWALETFGTSTVSLAGVDQGAATTLQLARSRPASIKAMLVFAGGGLDPWPQANVDFIQNQLKGFPTDLPIMWADFIRETKISGQGPLILEALQALGCQIVEVQEILGGLNFTQAGDRTVLWAEELR